MIKRNIHLIRADNPSRLCFRHYLFINKDNIGVASNVEFKNIYITSDEEPKDGDWTYYENGDVKGIYKIVHGQRPKTMILKKISLTTDEQLIKDGVQRIDDEFLEWLINNPNCDEVQVYYDLIEFEFEKHSTRKKYTTIIPKEKTKQGIDIQEFKKKANEIIANVKSKETLEEAAENYTKDGTKHYMEKTNVQLGFIEGAKWQQERMYSEEDMIAFGNFAKSYKAKRKVIKAFEQFKKLKHE